MKVIFPAIHEKMPTVAGRPYRALEFIFCRADCNIETFEAAEGSRHKIYAGEIADDSFMQVMEQLSQNLAKFDCEPMTVTFWDDAGNVDLYILGLKSVGPDGTVQTEMALFEPELILEAEAPAEPVQPPLDVPQSASVNIHPAERPLNVFDPAIHKVPQ